MQGHKLVLLFLLASMVFCASPVFAVTDESVTDSSAGNLIRSATSSFTSDMGKYVRIILTSAGEKLASVKMIQEAKAGIKKNSITLKQGLFTQSSRNFTAGLLDGFENLFGEIKIKLNGNQ